VVLVRLEVMEILVETKTAMVVLGNLLRLQALA
jgi:hypothetical protein